MVTTKAYPNIMAATAPKPIAICFQLFVANIPTSNVVKIKNWNLRTTFANLSSFLTPSLILDVILITDLRTNVIIPIIAKTAAPAIIISFTPMNLIAKARAMTEPTTIIVPFARTSNDFIASVTISIFLMSALLTFPIFSKAVTMPVVNVLRSLSTLKTLNNSRFVSIFLILSFSNIDSVDAMRTTLSLPLTVLSSLRSSNTLASDLKHFSNFTISLSLILANILMTTGSCFNESIPDIIELRLKLPAFPVSSFISVFRPEPNPPVERVLTCFSLFLTDFFSLSSGDCALFCLLLSTIVLR